VIEQDDIGRAFVAEFVAHASASGVVYLENDAMKRASDTLARDNQSTSSMPRP
jgi:hypothetical protein